MKDKTDHLLEAIEYPDRFSEEEIRRMLEDDENRQLYKLIGKISDALTDTSDQDINDEWEHFVKEHRNNTTSINKSNNFLQIFFTRNAAAILVSAVASLAVVATTIGVTHSLEHSKEMQTQKDDELVVTSQVSDHIEKNNSVQDYGTTPIESQTIVFKDESLGTIISTIADYYGAKVTYKSEKSKELRLFFQWDQSLPLIEIMEQLNNFEQINIEFNDNTLTIE